MKKTVFAVIILSVLSVLLIFCSGCGDKETVTAPETSVEIEETEAEETVVKSESDSYETTAKTEKTKKVDENHPIIEDIDWTVEPGIYDGERRVLLSYTNNSPYTIVGFEIKFSEKDGVTDEERSNFIDDLIEIFDFDETDEDDKKYIEQYSAKEISMYGESDKFVTSGNSDSDIRCKYYTGYYYVTDYEHYSLVEPDIVTIKYIDEKKIYTVYYDYITEGYTKSREVESAYSWDTGVLGGSIPAPEADYVECSGWDNSYFNFEIHGWSYEQYEKYVQQCRDAGYKLEEGGFDGYYYAQNADGYYITLDYDEDDCSVDGSLCDLAVYYDETEEDY